MTGRPSTRCASARPPGSTRQRWPRTWASRSRGRRQGEYLVAGAGTPALVATLTAWLAEHDLPLADLRAGRQRLEDVFLRLVSDPVAARRRPDGAGGGAGREAARSPTCASSWRCSPATASRCCSRSASPCCCWCSSPTSTCCPSTASRSTSWRPGCSSLAVLSTAFVNLAIGTAFEREYGVLKRLGATPLGRPRLLAAKTLAILAVEVVQIAVLWPLALALGWDPSPEPAFVAGRGARHRGVRRARAVPGRHPEGAGGAGRRQRPLPRAAAAVGHGDPARRAARPGAGRRRAPCRAAPSPRWCAAP